MLLILIIISNCFYSCYLNTLLVTNQAAAAIGATKYAMIPTAAQGYAAVIPSTSSGPLKLIDTGDLPAVEHLRQWGVALFVLLVVVGTLTLIYLCCIPTTAVLVEAWLPTKASIHNFVCVVGAPRSYLNQASQPWREKYI